MKERALVWGAGLAAFLVVSAVGFLVWSHRLELFVIPSTLREALRLSALRQKETGLRDSSSPVQAELDRLLGGLLVLRIPGCDPGRNFKVDRLRSHEGGTVYFIRYRDDDRICRHLLLDLRGRPIWDELDVFDWHHHFGCDLVPQSQYAFDIVHADTSRGDPYSSVGRHRAVDDSYSDFSVDARGWVPHGEVVSDELRAAVVRRSGTADKARELDPLLTSLLSSPRVGDLYRGLYLIDTFYSERVDLALPLLEHPNAGIRARAVAVVGIDPLLIAYLAPRLNDPDPRVRLSAAYALRKTEDGSRVIEPLTRDSHPAVAAAARLLLAR